MVKMGTVWDRAVEVINGRTGMLASIAALTLWLPTVVRQAIGVAVVGGNGTAATPPTSGTLLLLFLLSLVTAALAILGQLALIAVASDPATTRAEAFRVAATRLPLAIGLSLLLALVVFALLVPGLVPVVAVLAHPGAMSQQAMATAMAGISPGSRAFMGLYILLLVAVMIWLTARLVLLNPVIVNEREGVASFARSFALTRGLTWKIIGLAILLLIVAAVVVLAVQSVTGILFRLLLGADNAGLVALLTTAAVAVATSAITIVWTCFVAQLYVAVRRTSAAG